MVVGERLGGLKRELEVARSGGGTSEAELRELDSQVSEVQRVAAEHAGRDKLLREIVHEQDAGRQDEPEEDGNRRKIEGQR